MPVRQKKLPLATQAGRSPVIGQPKYIDIGETACRPNIIEPGQPPSFITPPKLEISLREWLIIERRYDEKLEPKTRAQLQAASAKYLYNAKMEHAALPLTLANDTFADLLKSACNFLKRLAPVQGCATDTHTFIRARLQPKLRLPSQRLLGDQLSGFRRDLEAFIDAMNQVNFSPGPCSQEDAAKIKATWEVGVQMRGAAWDAWVNDVTTIIKQVRLPYGVMKGAVPHIERDSSQFVRLIAALQDQFPDEDFYKPFRKLPSIAEAIYRARKRVFSRTQIAEYTP